MQREGESLWVKMIFFFASRRRHTRWNCDWSSDVCSSDLGNQRDLPFAGNSAGQDRHLFARPIHRGPHKIFTSGSSVTLNFFSSLFFTSSIRSCISFEEAPPRLTIKLACFRET